MSYTLTVENKSKYLHITVRGQNSPENVLSYLSEVKERCVEHKCSSVLIEEDLRGPGLRTFSVFDIITEASKRVQSMALRIAYLDVNPEHSMDELKFAETVAVNRGVHVKVCSSMAEAEKWLTMTP